MPEQTIEGATPEMMAASRDDSGRLDLEKLQQMAAGTYEESPFDSCEVAGMGVPNAIGEFILNASLARIMLLSMFGSPFMDDSEETVRPNVIETATAAYVLAHGPESLTPLFAAARFEERLPILERLAEASPDHLAAVAECIDQLCQTMAKFEGRALAWFEVAAADMDFNEAVLEVNDTIQAALEAYHRIPDDDA